MLKLDETMPVPIKVTQDGNVRVSGTRVTLHTIITAYQMGETPEKIHEAFDVVPVADVYAIIAYYLNNREAVDDYMREVDEIGEKWRKFWESQYTPQQKARLAELRQLAEEKRKVQDA